MAISVVSRAALLFAIFYYHDVPLRLQRKSNLESIGGVCMQGNVIFGHIDEEVFSCVESFVIS